MCRKILLVVFCLLPVFMVSEEKEFDEEIWKSFKKAIWVDDLEAFVAVIDAHNIDLADYLIHKRGITTGQWYNTLATLSIYFFSIRIASYLAEQGVNMNQIFTANFSIQEYNAQGVAVFGDLAWQGTALDYLNFDLAYARMTYSIYKKYDRNRNKNAAEQAASDKYYEALRKTYNMKQAEELIKMDEFYITTPEYAELKTKGETLKKMLLSHGGLTLDEVQSVQEYIDNYSPNYKTNDDLRLRKGSNLDDAIILTMPVGLELEVLEKGRKETIDGIKGQWVKVFTKNYNLGWCFDGYLDKM